MDGAWTTWAAWSDSGMCSVTCAEGMVDQQRIRTCTEPAPLHGGMNCSGNDTESQSVPCTQPSCPGKINYESFRGIVIWKSDTRVTRCSERVNRYTR